MFRSFCTIGADKAYLTGYWTLRGFDCVYIGAILAGFGGIETGRCYKTDPPEVLIASTCLIGTDCVSWIL